MEHSYSIGIMHLSPQRLLVHQSLHQPISLKIVGMLVIDDNITPELAKATIQELKIYGMLIAPLSIQVALLGRIQIIGFCLEAA